MSNPKEGPFTIDPVTAAFRTMQRGKPSRPGAGTINRSVVAPFSVDGFEANSSTTLATPKPEQHVDRRRVTKSGLDTPQAQDWEKFNEAQKKKQPSIYWPRGDSEG